VVAVNDRAGLTSTVRRRIAAAGAVGACVIVCMVFVDRPLAVWLDQQFRGGPIYEASLRGLYPLKGLGLIGALLLVGGGVWRIVGGSIPRSIRRLVDALLAAAVALALTLFLKWAIGRSDADPLFLRDHIYAFHPFRRGEGYGAFPSSTLAVSSAFLSGLGITRQRDRLVAGCVLLVLLLAVLITNSHWLADLIGGTFLGVTIGTAMRSRAQSREGMSAPPADA
jgi:hypothetical protein